jgi:hypothetical protein
MKFLADAGVVADGHMGAAATDNANAIEDAIGASMLNPAGLTIDNGGAMGDVFIPPRGVVMIGRQLNLPNGAVYDGGSSVASVIRMKETMDPTKPLFLMGDQTVYPGIGRVSSFGAAVRNVAIVDKSEDPASFNVPILFTDNVQDTRDMIASVRIYTKKRMAIKAITGIGGASFVHIRDVISSCSAPGSTNIFIHYSEGTQVLLEHKEPASARDAIDPENKPAAGTIGVCVKGGDVKFIGFHNEQVEHGIFVDLQATRPDGSTKSRVRISGAQGGPRSTSCLTIANNPRNTGKIKVEDMQRNGSLHTVYDGRSGYAHIDTDIDAWTTF